MHRKFMAYLSWGATALNGAVIVVEGWYPFPFLLSLPNKEQARFKIDLSSISKKTHQLHKKQSFLCCVGKKNVMHRKFMAYLSWGATALNRAVIVVDGWSLPFLTFSSKQRTSPIQN